MITGASWVTKDVLHGFPMELHEVLHELRNPVESKRDLWRGNGGILKVSNNAMIKVRIIKGSSNIC